MLSHYKSTPGDCRRTAEMMEMNSRNQFLNTEEYGLLCNKVILSEMNGMDLFLNSWKYLQPSCIEITELSLSCIYTMLLTGGEAIIDSISMCFLENVTRIVAVDLSSSSYACIFKILYLSLSFRQDLVTNYCIEAPIYLLIELLLRYEDYEIANCALLFLMHLTRVSGQYSEKFFIKSLDLTRYLARHRQIFEVGADLLLQMAKHDPLRVYQALDLEGFDGIGSEYDLELFSTVLMNVYPEIDIVEEDWVVSTLLSFDMISLSTPDVFYDFLTKIAKDYPRLFSQEPWSLYVNHSLEDIKDASFAKKESIMRFLHELLVYDPCLPSDDLQILF